MSDKELATQPQLETQSQPATVGDLLRVAVETGLNADAMEKLVELQIRMRAEDASAAFAAAYSEMQGRLPPVLVNRDGHQNRYATLDQIERVVRPILTENGFSYSYTTRDGGSMVICRLRHRLGHVEETEFPAHIDKAARMNDSQKVASAASYARRYALLLALGVSTTDMVDDDAESLHETITAQESADLAALCEEVGADREKFLAWAGVASFEEIRTGDKARIVRGLEAKRAKA